MNEQQLIRGELASQRRRARELAASRLSRVGQISDEISESYRLYFELIIDLESLRVASHLERLRARPDLSAGERAALERCAREFERLTAARAPHSSPSATACHGVERHAEVLTPLSTLVEELETIAESRYSVNDWRRAAHIDADSILEERRLHARALGEAHGPASD